jgi:putative ABC transport system permease protein
MFGNYLKMAWKVLARRKFFTFISLFGIGFTLITLMLVVALADHALSPSYPETQLDRMLMLEELDMFGEVSTRDGSPGFKFLDTYSRDLPGVQRMSVYTPLHYSSLFLEGRKVVLKPRYSDAEYWQIMEFKFLEGAAFGAHDDANANHVAVISADVRRQLFGNDNALGKTVELSGSEFRIIGVVENVPQYRKHSSADIWLPLGTLANTAFFENMIGGCRAAYLLEPDADPEQVQAAFQERLTRVEFKNPERFHTMRGRLMNQLELYADEFLKLDAGDTAPRKFVMICILMGLLFMVLPAVNLVNISLSRISERSAEIGVRKAFGAAGPDLVLQFVTENIVLSLIGGAISLLGTYLLMKLALLFPQLPFLGLEMNWRIFTMALVLTIIFGLFSGTWPAWKMSRQHPVKALKGGLS